MDMKTRAALRDACIAAVISAALVIAVLLPYALRPQLSYSKAYRGVLIFVSALAMPLIDRLPMSSEAVFLPVAALITWAVNTLALFIAVRVVTLTWGATTSRQQS